MSDLVEDTQGRVPFRWLFRWGGRVGGNIAGRDIGGGLAAYRMCGRGGGLRGGGPAPEWVAHTARAAAVLAGVVVAAGRAVTQRAGGVGAGGLALADEVVAVLADGGGLAAGLPQAAKHAANQPARTANRRTRFIMACSLRGPSAPPLSCTGCPTFGSTSSRLRWESPLLLLRFPNLNLLLQLLRCLVAGSIFSASPTS